MIMFLLPLNLHVLRKYTISNLNMITKLSLRCFSQNFREGNLTNILNYKCFRKHCSSKPESYIQHKYSDVLENAINCQIQEEFKAGYTYLNIASHFARSDIALPGVHGFFMKMFYEELEHVLGFIKYQTLRGGTVNLNCIDATKPSKWDLPTVFAYGLDMEKLVKEKIQTIHKQAEEIGDSDVVNFLDGYIEHQEKSLQEMSRYYTRTKLLANEPIGTYLLDRELHQTHVRKKPIKFNIETANSSYS